jgi:serine/threonine-protein kinase
MIEFRTLGTLDLRDSSSGHEVRSILAGPKRVAILAYLAVAAPRGLDPREKLLAMFWPEASDARARNGLNQFVFVLRRGLGQSVLITRGEDEIGLDRDGFWCDAVAFEEALDEGRREEALRLYGGDLLDGFYLDGCPAFERWLEGERDRLRGRALEAALFLAGEEESAGNLVGALPWYHRARSLAPFDESLERRLLGLLQSLGDRTGAIREYEAFEERLAQELELEPSVETRELAEAIRAKGPPETEAAVSLRKGAPAKDVAGGAARDSAAPIPNPAIPPTPTARAERRFGWRGATAATAALVLLVAVGVVALRGPAAQGVDPPVPALNPQQVPALDPKRVLVAGFENLTGDPELDPFGLVAADWITQELGRTGLVRVVPFFTVLRETPYLELNVGDTRAIAQALAEQTGAGILVTGSYVQEGEGLALQAQIVDVATGELLAGIDGLSASAEAPTEILGELRGRVAGALAGVLDPRLASWANVASRPPSIEAYRLYIQGLDRFLHPAGRFKSETALEDLEAADVLRRAAARDSIFTAPLIWAVLAYRNAFEFGRADSLLRRLEAVEDRLAPWDRAMVAYHRAGLSGDREEQYRAAKRVVELSPDSEWSYKLAQAAMSLNRPREAADILLAMDPDRGWIGEWFPYWRGLSFALHLAGDYDAEQAAVERFRYRFPNKWSIGWVVAIRTRALVGLGRTEEALRLPVDTDTHIPHGEVALHLRAHGHEKPARRAIDAYLSKWVDGADTMPPSRYAAQFLEEVGRWDDAGSVIERGIARWAEAEGSTQPLSRLSLNSLVNWHGEAGVLAAKTGERGEVERHLRWLEELKLPYPFGRTAIWQAQIAAQLGEKKEAVELLRRAFAEGYADHISIHLGFHHLEPLRDYPPFVELVRAKG